MSGSSNETWRFTAVRAFHRAIEAVGGQSRAADLLDCTQSNLSQLIKKGSLLPSRHVLRLESASGVSKHLLRPDIYPLSLPSESNASGEECEDTLPAYPATVACDPTVKLQRKDIP
ncbi:YdaS family helix-turn-helix protein [Sphingobium yanoikuyae]|uniref:transcriptional regulator n=1 Tax=Sphingobium yanoikuyae TaxID=13690 RepID=UPI00240EB61F|nr:YdaS family helix-turn-helix protein [Sphingobium yanoikuyae]MDG2515636.1 YdaS family helix-turn-helix protein [Sphingobium yanoikuyae]